ncbi:MAG: competence/damage-inducible protein A [Flavobacteriales bacterium]|jgi:nicotinamide-nucleotide amidase|nr:competence/damage-inducible protein A [Flavobacteriales bacterium]
MKTEIISIGDEILIGQTVNTNATWMGQELAKIGIKNNRTTTISDSESEILEALKLGESRSDLILITGGLGPTKDDITKKVLCDYFNTELELNQEVLTDIQAYFKLRNKPFLESNNLQAMLPKACTVLRNHVGTASGMWFERNGKVFVSMPGVPYEMKHLMETGVFPKVKEQFGINELAHRTVLTHGLGESFLAEIIEDWENRVRAEGLDMAYLPSPGLVKLRITSTEGNQQIIDKYCEELYPLIPEYIFGEGIITMQETLANLLKERNATISLAESCTGGFASHLLTAIPGSSSFYEGSIICYSYDIKEKELNVPKDLLLKKGAVSEEVVEILSEEIRKKYNTNYSIAISGIAGPTGGTDDKPVGTVWISARSKNKVVSKKFSFGNNRERNISQSALASFNLLRKLILEE